MNARLYGLSSASRLYMIDTAVATATQVGSVVFSPPLSGTEFGFDFSPVVDRIRVVSNTEQNFRLNPTTGAVSGVDAFLAYAGGDPHQSDDPGVGAVAYTNNVPGALFTTAYVLDADFDQLARLGGVDGVPSANGGTLTSIGALGVAAAPPTDMDVAADGTGYVMLTPTGQMKLYTVNLGTGELSLVRSVATVEGYVDIAVELPTPPTPTPSPSPTASPTPSPAPTMSPTPSPTASPPPSPTPTQSPTTTPSSTADAESLKGDVDCDGDVDAVDALRILRFVSSLDVGLPAGCAPIGQP